MIEQLEARRLLAATGTINGTIFRDYSQDRKLNDAEPVVAGLRVWLDLNKNGAVDAGEPIATSDASGHFQFSSVVPGKYEIGGLRSDRWESSAESKNPVTVVADQTTIIHFAVYKKYQVQGIVFDDTNADGKRQSSEAPLADAQIEATYTDLKNRPQSISVTSDSQGAYRIFLPIDFQYELSYVATPSRRATDFPKNISPIEGNRTTADMGSSTRNLIQGEVFDDESIKRVPEPNGLETISDWTVFIDTNHNGKRDAGEPSMPTDYLGTYRFNNLPSGTYTIVAHAHSPYASTTPTSQTVTLKHGQVAMCNFGFAIVNPISGTVFNDAQGHGMIPDDTPTLPNVTVFSDINNNGKLDPGEPSAVSDANGNYTVDAFEFIDANIRAVPPAGFHEESPSSDQEVVLTKTSAISIEPFDDHNGNGKQDKGEPDDQDFNGELNIGLALSVSGSWQPLDLSPYDPFTEIDGLQPGEYQLTFSLPDPNVHLVETEAMVSLKAGQLLTLKLGLADN